VTDQTSGSAIEQLPLALAQTKNDPQAKALICNLANENDYVCRVFFHRSKGNAVGGALDWTSFPLLDLVFRP